MPKRGYKQPETQKRAKAEQTRQWWEQIKAEVEETNKVLLAVGSEPVTVHQYLRGEQPEKPKPKKKYKMTKEHKEKLRQAAIRGNYAERLKPYQKPKLNLSPAEERARKYQQGLKRQQRASRKRAAMRFARRCMIGAKGETIRNAIMANVGSLDVREDYIVLEVVDYLIEIGFLEPFSTVSVETRRKMSESARAAHYRRKNAVAELQESVRRKWRKEIGKK